MATPIEIYNSFEGDGDQDAKASAKLIDLQFCCADGTAPDSKGLLKPSASTVIEAIKSGSLI